MLPPSPPLVPPFAISVALPAVEVVSNSVWPPFAPLTMPPLLVIVAVPAVELSNAVVPPCAPLTVPPRLVKLVEFPAVALFVKNIVPAPAPFVSVTKFCVVPELLVMPGPLIVSVVCGLAVMV